jgi:cell division septation protein DedD
MRLFKILAAGMLAVMLSGCFAATAVISNPNQVVVEALSAKSAAVYAQRRCREHRRHAVYLRDGGSAYWFACRQIDPVPMEAIPEGEMAQVMSAVKPAAHKSAVDKHAKTSKPMKKMADKLKNSGKPVRLSKKRKKSRMNKEVSRPTKGSIWVQVAASKRRNDAAEFARRVIKRNKDLIGTRSISVQRARLRHAGTIYRSRVGPFRQHAAAENVCKKLKARRQDCLVATR